ncbi:MAG TPA: hypothetical protein VEY67_01020 [Candidatus Dormibacteraeota bacterium]|nr:hypothetical protein [Candidatus Dormibacteraeota bacterium]
MSSARVDEETGPDAVHETFAEVVVETIVLPAAGLEKPTET